jgi:CHASE2 domain-containing sensor protein
MAKFSLAGHLDRHFVFKEALFATLFTMVVTYLVSFIPLKFEFSKAIRQDFSGFDVYDLYYSGKSLGNAERDKNIVLIEIAGDRASIARQVELIEKHHPAVIGIDAFFEEQQQSYGSFRLAETLEHFDNIIVGSRYLEKPEGITTNYFDKPGQAYPSGYCNFIGNEYSVIRYYPPFIRIQDSVYESFTSAIARKYAPGKYDILRKRNNKKELINYVGNLESYDVLSKDQLPEADSSGQLETRLNGKIVLLGYFVKDPTPPVLSDLRFSPVNKRISGKSYPDMYGVVIHANILSMIISGNYAHQASDFVAYVFASLIIFFFLYYMLHQYKRKQHPSHGKFMLIQFLLVLLVLFLFVQVFSLSLFKTPLLPVMIALVLCLELLGLYKNIALWAHKKYQYKTVFAHKHII